MVLPFIKKSMVVGMGIGIRVLMIMHMIIELVVHVMV
jgi:hypothetical protein